MPAIGKAAAPSMDMILQFKRYSAGRARSWNVLSGVPSRGVWIAVGMLVGALLFYLHDTKQKKQSAADSFCFSVAEGDARRVKQYLAAGNSPDASDMTGTTPLYYACMGNRRDVAELLLAAGADVHHRNHAGMSIIHAAAVRGSSDLIRCLIDHGADPDARDQNGATPMMLAALIGNRDAIQVLAERGARVDAVNR